MDADPSSSSERRVKKRRASSGRRAATITDVALAAGVSTATVSRVLANNGRVDKELARRVISAVDQLRYQPNRVARRLRSPGRQLIALVVPDIENPFFTRTARGVEDAARESGTIVLLFNSDLDAERETRYFETAVRENVGGVVLAASSPSVDISVLQQAHVPVVVVNQPLKSCEVQTFTSDNYMGGALAAEEFLRHGYQRVAAIVGRSATQGWNDRLRGLENTLVARGGRLVDVKYMNNRIDGGQRAMEDLLAVKSSFQGVFVSNNQMTVGALRALQSSGIAIPEEMGLIGCDLSSTPMTYPVEITSVDQDPRQMGFLAGSWILDEGVQDSPTEVIYLRPVLSRGDSLLDLGHAS